MPLLSYGIVDAYEIDMITKLSSITRGFARDISNQYNKPR